MSRLRANHGFTVVEVLVAMSIGLVVITGMLTLLNTTTRLNTGVVTKTDAMQRGRVAMDLLTQQVRSQVCLDRDHPAIVAGDDNSVTFYADFTDAGRTAKRRVTFDGKKITAYRWDAPAAVSPILDTSFPAAPTATQLVLENATRQVDTANQPIPFFRYYAYGKDANGILRPDTKLATPLDADAASRVVRIDISYLALPPKGSDSAKGVNLSDQVMVRHVDQNAQLDDPAAVPEPNCI